MTRVTGLGCGLLFLLSWTTGCRSERVAFQFQPVLTQAAASVPAAIANGTSGDTTHLAISLPPGTPEGATPPVPLHGHQHKPHSSGTTTATRGEQLLPPLTLQTNSPSGIAAKPRRSIDDPPWGGIMFFLGGAICVAAVIVGINMGGFLG